MPTLECPHTSPTGTPARPILIPGIVTQYLVCPTVALNGVTIHGHSVAPRVLIPGNAALFAAMTHALGEHGLVDESVSACPASGQIPIVILIHAVSGAYRADLPTGACGSYVKAVVDAFRAVEK